MNATRKCIICATLSACIESVAEAILEKRLSNNLPDVRHGMCIVFAAGQLEGQGHPSFYLCEECQKEISDFGKN